MTTPPTPPNLTDIKALTFDVFGTVVDWRASITSALRSAFASKLHHSPSLSPEAQAYLTSLTQPQSQPLADFAQAWRTSYGEFTRSFVPGTTPWKDIDTHHRDSLVSLLASPRFGLQDQDQNEIVLFSPEEIENLSRAWHFLVPWPDSSEGIHRLNRKYVTATLSNGNLSLLEDLNSQRTRQRDDDGGQAQAQGLGFQKLISAEDFRAYKPNPAVYLGACEKLGLRPEEVAMVAAHLGDLAAARALGMRTVYVERREEEEWKEGEARFREARGWVDLWVAEGEGGFVEVARRLGV